MKQVVTAVGGERRSLRRERGDNMNGNQKRQAVIFIPGVGGAMESAKTVAQRIAAELRRISTSVPEPVFSVSAEKTVGFGDGQTAKMATVSVREGGTDDIAVMDVYFFDYQEVLTKREKSANILWKLALLTWTFVVTLGYFARASNPLSRTEGLGRKDQAQLAIGLLVLGVIGISVCASFYLILEGAALQFGAKEAAGTSMIPPKLLSLGSAALAILAAVGISSSSIGSWFTGLAERTAASVRYLTIGDGRGAVTGPLEDLIDHVAHGDYDQRHIFAYSFGCIVALDALFTRGGRSGHHFSAVTSLATIGCPFDVVRHYLPEYFRERRPAASDAQRWINIYSPADVFGSNFRNDGELGEASVGIGSGSVPENIAYVDAVAPEKFSWINILFFIGLRAHGMYWEKEPCSETSVFRPLLEALMNRREPAPVAERV
ncbi:MAG TPA: hypothetical protein VNX25_07190 [Verrucomicrobiae bacterium]|nr:hypothetical protein [Verrucomicrobiae bacterium]